MLQIINDYPPNINEIRKYLPIHDKVVFTYGYRLFNPKGYRIDPALMKHEMKHADQQAEYGMTGFWIPAKYRIYKWWRRYLRDKAFRLSQELPAYQSQYQEYAKILKDRNKLHNLTLMLAKDLASPLYGSLLSTAQALEAIKNPILYKFRV